MNDSIFWFRNDLRLMDNPALALACSKSDRLVLLAVASPDETPATKWGFPRCGAHRRTFRDQSLGGLKASIELRGGTLHIIDGAPGQVIADAAHRIGATRVFCEAIAAPEEIAEIAALRQANIEVHDQWQSSLLDPIDLPFRIEETPEVFTAFRKAVESSNPRILAPVQVPHLRTTAPVIAQTPWAAAPASYPRADSSFPFQQPAFQGSEIAAVAHLECYFESPSPRSYKATRNELMGIDYSTKFSPWLALGALSARTVYRHLQDHEARFGANDSTYWIWFELLWRDFFRFSSLKHGARLFRARGLGHGPLPGHDERAFRDWCAGRTGHAFIDAGMRELAATGYLSNRLRQVVASYLVHELACDWRAGAAWFESQLIDYDVCSNQGNWLYISGRGADPRQGRRFSPDKQAAIYDPDEAYRRQWCNKRIYDPAGGSHGLYDTSGRMPG